MSRALLALVIGWSVCVASNAWNMKPVRSIQARVQGAKPVYNAEKKVWTSPYPSEGKFEDKWAGSVDTVNTASVEGALMYVQAEGIDQDILPGCDRKNKMQYIWFYNVTFAQTNASIAEYGNKTNIATEYCPYVAMDNGACTKYINKDNELEIPPECKQFAGIDGQPNLGPCVGGEPRTDDQRALYLNNYWFSFPNSCFNQQFAAKNSSCRRDFAGGLCPRGTIPDGIKCTFTAEVMGYLNIDDIVGITSIVNNKTNKPYASRTEFCNDGGIEFKSQSGTMIPFWKDPKNATANEERSHKMMAMYQAAVEASKSTPAPMIPLPSIDELNKNNPKCYENNVLCRNAELGCRRKLLAQICEVCTQSAPDCEKAPNNAPPFPTLQRAPRTVSDCETTSPPRTNTSPMLPTGASSSVSKHSPLALISLFGFIVLPVVSLLTVV